MNLFKSAAALQATLLVALLSNSKFNEASVFSVEKELEELPGSVLQLSGFTWARNCVKSLTVSPVALTPAWLLLQTIHHRMFNLPKISGDLKKKKKRLAVELPERCTALAQAAAQAFSVAVRLQGVVTAFLLVSPE